MNATISRPKRAVRTELSQRPLGIYNTPQRSASAQKRTSAQTMVLEMPAPAPTYTPSGKWDPNFPVHCTQEEFIEHIRSIEADIDAGNFMTAEEAEQDFEQWKKEFLASRI